MEFIESETERTTAITDLALAAATFGNALILFRPTTEVWKARVWAIGFICMGIAALFGAILHGFRISAATERVLWRPINFFLGITIALFITGTIYDQWGPQYAQRLLLVMIIIGLAFFVLIQLIAGGFIVFIFYEGIALFIALFIYTALSVKGQLPGAGLTAFGILLTITAAVIQATESIRFTLIWPFDHNGVFHLVQIVGVVFITTGVQASL